MSYRDHDRKDYDSSSTRKDYERKDYGDRKESYDRKDSYERKYSPSRGSSSSATGSSRFKDSSDRRFSDRYTGSSTDSYSSRYTDRYHDADSRSDRKFPPTSNYSSAGGSYGGGSKYNDGELGSRLPTQNWQETIKFEKNFYKEHPSVASMSEMDVMKFRKLKDITISGTEVPKPIRSFEESSFPGKILFLKISQFFF